MSIAEVTAPTDAEPESQWLGGDVRDGILAMVPFVVGFAPFALVIGAAAAHSGDPLAGWSGSWLIYGGQRPPGRAALAWTPVCSSQWRAAC